MDHGKCFGVSVGPGDKELITLEAISVIQSADVIFLPSFPKEDCKAYQIIKRIYPDIDSKRLCPETFTMSRDASVMTRRHEEILGNAKTYLDEGLDVAFLTLGEVALYSTYLYIHELLIKQGYTSVLVSGISSVQAAAAKLGIALAIGADELHILPGVDNIEAKLAYDGTKVFMKTRKCLDEAINTIQKYVLETPGAWAMGVSNCGMEDERVARCASELTNLEGYFTILIVGVQKSTT